MNIHEYELQGRAEYHRLAQTVHDILSAALAQLKGVRVQQIQFRAKDILSLRRKMADRAIGDKDPLEPAIKDLAGCRLIFYTNADVATFLGSSIIRENFDIDWDRTKVHYPFNDADADQLFVSYNYVVRLKEPRAGLPEHAGLAGLCCEVQVQTILDHAWSEMAHDTLYKPPVQGFGTRRMSEVRLRMTDIMTKYLAPAGFDFQKIMADVAEVRRAQEFFESKPLERLASATSNQERIDLLENIHDYLLPHCDDLPSVAPDIRAVVVAAIEDARKTQEDHDDGTSYRFYRVETVLAKGCNILDRLRYLDEASVATTFDLFCRLYVHEGNSEQNERLIESVRNLAGHTLGIWRVRGPLVQKLLLDRISRLSIAEVDAHRELIVATLAQVLATEVTGTSSNFDSVTFETGAVIVSPELADIRDRAWAILEGMFLRADTDDQRKQILQVLNGASRLPHQASYSDELMILSLETSTRFVCFFTAQWQSLSYNVRQKVEHDIFWKHRRSVRSDKTDGLPAARQAAGRLTDAILIFREIADLDTEYVIFKTLIGFDEVLAPYWDSPETDFGKSYRNTQIKQFVADVNAQNFPEWRRRLEALTNHRSEDAATFVALSRFLTILAEEKPDLAITLLEAPSENMALFLANILSGLAGGACHDETVVKLAAWIGAGEHLLEIAKFLWRPKMFDPGILERVFEAAKSKTDQGAIWACLRAAGEHAIEYPRLIQSVILPALDYLSEHQVPRWQEALLYSKGGQAVLAMLTAENAAKVFEAVLRLSTIDHSAEEILAALAPVHGNKVIDFFGRRLEAEEARAGGSYEAVPYELHALPERMVEYEAYAIQSSWSWFNRDDDLFVFRGGAVVARLFPEVSRIESHLKNFLDTNGSAGLRFIVQILRSYSDGGSSRSPIIRDIVARLPEDDPLLNEVSAIIGQTGVLSGDFGRVGAETEQRNYMLTWLTDARPEVRRFAEREIRQLENSMAAEQRRSMEELQLRKRNWGAA